MGMVEAVVPRDSVMMTCSEISPGLTFPVIKRSQASAHSRTISVAYLAQPWSAN